MSMDYSTTLEGRTGSADVSAVGPASGPLRQVLQRLDKKAPRFLASAPYCLDVMGGVTEYTGGLVVQLALAPVVGVVAQPRDDDVVSVESPSTSATEGDGKVELSCRELSGASGEPVDAEKRRKVLCNTHDPLMRCVLGTLVEAMDSRAVPTLNGGLSVIVAWEGSEQVPSGGHTALAAATLVAASRAFDVSPEPLQAATLCQRVENDWLGQPSGLAGAVGVLLGEPHRLTQLGCDPCTFGKSIPVPDGIRVVGIECGAPRADAVAKYERGRTAAFMGRVLIDRIIRHEQIAEIPWDGYLSRVSVADFVERFRDRIPMKLAGREFLDRFGETGDPLTRVSPDYVYKVRSRTEHHIYEHARSERFVQCLSRAAQGADVSFVREAGELMYASHWSYGQRCGLGSIETDALVSLVRQRGLEEGIYGAKVSGRGCGGVVTVLMEAGTRAEEALTQAISECARRTGKELRLMAGASPGALIAGARQV